MYSTSANDDILPEDGAKLCVSVVDIVLRGRRPVLSIAFQTPQSQKTGRGG